MALLGSTAKVEDMFDVMRTTEPDVEAAGTSPRSTARRPKSATSTATSRLYQVQELTTDDAGDDGDSKRDSTAADEGGHAQPDARGAQEDEEGGEDEEEEEEEEILSFVYQEPKDKSDPSAGMAEIQEQWTQNHGRALYMMSLFAVAAQTAEDSESWIRQVPLLVLIYEGVVAGVLDYDYAPASMLISLNGTSRRVWLNVSQEGKAAIDDLREKGLVNGLKLSTEDFQPVTAFQVSAKGMQFVKQIPQSHKDAVHSFLYPPKPLPRELLRVTFMSNDEIATSPYKFVKAGDEDGGGADGDDQEADEEDDEEGLDGSFVMLAEKCRYARLSSVTDAEDLSYVSSPVLPSCVRNPRDQRPFTSNAHRAHESAAGINNVRDELDEAIVLSDVMTLVGEWIPFGSNQICALNERLGASDRCQGGLFTAMVDTAPTKTNFQVPPGLTQVSILDYDLVRFINFEAEIHYPEDEGIIQVENFGMHLNVDGTILYGIRMEAIQERKHDSISLDQLSRVLVDVHQDSSSIMNDLLSSYQRGLLDMVFMGDADARGKYNMIIAEAVEPFQPAEEYMNNPTYANELKQVIGDLHHAHDIGDAGVLIIGQNGILVAGANALTYEKLLVTYLALLVKEVFIRNFFTRTFILDDLPKRTRKLILSYRDDPNHVIRIRFMLNNASKDIVMMEEILGYLGESLETIVLADRPNDAIGARLYDVLNVKGMLHDVELRAKDLRKLVHGARHELGNLQQMTNVINTKLVEDVVKNINSNTKYLVDASAATERASKSLAVMQIILAGSFAFDVIDRVSGGTLGLTPPDWVNFLLVDPIIAKPGLWWILNMLWLGLVSVLLTRLMGYLSSLSDGALTLRVKANRRIKVDALQAFLKTKTIEVADATSDTVADVKKVVWYETDAEVWKGKAPKVEIVVDMSHCFLLSILFQMNTRKSRASQAELYPILVKVLDAAGIIDHEAEAADLKTFKTMQPPTASA